MLYSGDWKITLYSITLNSIEILRLSVRRIFCYDFARQNTS